MKRLTCERIPPSDPEYVIRVKMTKSEKDELIASLAAGRSACGNYRVYETSTQFIAILQEVDK